MKTWKGLCEQIRIFLSYAYTRSRGEVFSYMYHIPASACMHQDHNSLTTLWSSRMADVRAVCESSVPQHVCYRTFSRTTLKCHLKEESSRQRSVASRDGTGDGTESTYDESGLSRLERVAPVRVEIDRREVSRNR
jgi:hypothetical protein